DRLADPEQIALTVLEPRGTLADAALARVVAGDLGHPVLGRQAGHVELLEHHTSVPEVRDGGVDVVDLPGHLGVHPRGGARRLEQRELAARAAVEQAPGPFFAWLEAELLGVERACAPEILRREPRGHPAVVEHDCRLLLFDRLWS